MAIPVKTYILSGGNSTRMGEDKGLKPILGKPGIMYLLEMLQAQDINPIIIANKAGYDQLGVQVINDLVSDKGPLGGVYTALNDAGTDVLILAADTPFVSAVVIQLLLEKREEDKINVVRYNGRIQPLCGVYPAACLKEVGERIRDSRLKMMDLLDGFPIHFIDLDGEEEVFHNNNTPADHAIAVNYLRKLQEIQK